MVRARFLETTEALLARLGEAGLDDATAIRSLALLTNLCFGHARDVLGQVAEHRPRRDEVLRDVLQGEGSRYPNLTRISRTGTDTYGTEQLDFTVEVFLAGVGAQLR